MRDEDVKKHLTIFFIVGFIIGIIYVNTIGKEAVLAYGLFDKYLIQQYPAADIKIDEYTGYIIRLRLLPFVLLGICGLTRIKKIVVFIFLIWTGILTGLLFTVAFAQLGMPGILFCILGITPHFLCYIAVYVMILRFLYSYPESRWNLEKTIFIVLMTGMGILLEVYVNPVLMKLFIRTL